MINIHLAKSPDQKAQESAVREAKISVELLYGTWLESPVCSCVSVHEAQRDQGARESAGWHWELRAQGVQVLLLDVLSV